MTPHSRKGRRLGTSQIADRPVLVTGASGFIGFHLSRRLLAEGAEVHGISRFDRSGEVEGVRWWLADVADPAVVHDVIRDVQPAVIFHLASEVTGKRDLEIVAPTFQANLASTVNLMTAAGEVGCRRFITTGSMEEPERGSEYAVPCSPYAAAKWAGSGYARMFHSLYQFPAVIMRVFMVYGPAQQDLKKLIPYVILSLLRGTAPELMSGGRLVDWIYVEDVVDALLEAATVPGIEGKTIDVGSGEQVAVREIVERLVSLVGSDVTPMFGTLEDRPHEQIRVADVAATYALMGWKPQGSLDEGLKRTVEWYRQKLKEGAL